MEINSTNAVQGANPASTNNATGAAAPQTTDQKADVSATRVVSPKETAQLEDKASSSEELRFQAVKSKAAKYITGANPFLNDIKFTIYGSSPITSGLNEYVIRFTDLGTGAIETKTESQLFATTSGGDLVSGNA